MFVIEAPESGFAFARPTMAIVSLSVRRERKAELNVLAFAWAPLNTLI